jgi:hypothetical protein
MKRLAMSAIALTLCGACATRNTAPRTCEPVSAEFTLEGQSVYRYCAVDRRARLSSRPIPYSYVPLAGRHRCSRASVDVVVDSTGRPIPETARIVRSTDPNFALAILQSLESARFEPAIKDGQPVAQLVRIESAAFGAVRQSGVRQPRRPPC